MNTATSRLLAAGGVLGLAAGLAVAPAAYADGTTLALTDPRVTPAPVVAGDGTTTQACDGSTPGWIGATGATPTLSVGVQAPASVTEQPRFRVLDETGATPVTLVENQAAPVVNGTASLGLTGLQNGHTYTWRAHLIAADGSRAVGPFCSFKVDTTAPTVSVSSTDFPASGSTAAATKYAGQTGIFTLSGLDPAPAGGAASGVACFRPVLNGSPSVFHCGDPGTVVPGADGTAKLSYKPTQWGTNVLQVQVMDNAGNVGAASYSFYALSNPNPPQAPGDVDNDGIPDIVLPDGAGNLQVISGQATSTTPTTVVPANQAPGGTGWGPFQFAHRGWDNTAPADTVFARDTRGGTIYVYRNFGSLDFSGGAEVLDRPSSCADVDEKPISCPADYTQDWSAVEQFVALGPADKFGGQAPWLLTVEHGNLWLFGDGQLQFGTENAQQLTTSGNWSNYDLVAPGQDAKGNLSLWARDRATGELHAYPLPLKANGIADFSALADPTAHGTGAFFTTAAYPTLGSSGDLDGDGNPDLWAVTADRHLDVFNGWTAPRDLGVLK
ncbi:hypothetical protein [Kitasatospora viridis]|uniref:VCBS repeat protein n=1 Tax=Kitasatospora viridis TaxID=281105 RepID=A0A561UJN7_9ACTN|nr:hypothetical protein [Kitasatospora viridis]TWF99580.1 hypothetical protein FHX73_113427 [Kitasatospora viridis]